LDTIQAAILKHKLAKLDGWNAMRRQAADWYNEVLQGTHLHLPMVRHDVEAVWHLYVVRTPYRDELKQYLQDKGVATGIHYPIPLHLAPVYKWMGYKEGDYPITEQECKQLLSLPMFPHITRDQVAQVAEHICAFEREKGIGV
jgi:dTDP-4-amino-4,6-dideoxygalactose transaminase